MILPEVISVSGFVRGDPAAERTGYITGQDIQARYWRFLQRGKRVFSTFCIFVMQQIRRR